MRANSRHLYFTTKTVYFYRYILSAETPHGSRKRKRSSWRCSFGKCNNPSRKIENLKTKHPCTVPPDGTLYAAVGGGVQLEAMQGSTDAAARRTTQQTNCCILQRKIGYNKSVPTTWAYSGYKKVRGLTHGNFNYCKPKGRYR